MASKIKNIIIFIIVAAVLVLAYFFFFKKAPEQASLTSSSGNSALVNTSVQDQNDSISKDFLSLLLSVKGIKLDDGIFSDSAFATLRDSSIELIPDGTEGRPNPFSPIGTDVLPIIDNTQTGTLTQTTGFPTGTTDTNTILGTGTNTGSVQ